MMCNPDNESITLYISGRPVCDSVLEIERSEMPGHRETLWRGDVDGLARLVIALANVRAENRELRMMLQRARKALDKK